MCFAIPLFFLAPMLLNIGFSALRKEGILLFLLLGIMLSLFAIFLALKGIFTIMNSFS